ncbi:MAG: NADP-dependent phosphogluconate dehydrogenase [Chitinophagaceae bacterium]|nr:NADP-dependent phosphogluconate dehydrogenase [Chitinophagaceae bacterium]
MHSIVFIMGVSGSGKTTVGELLSDETGIPFFDADDFHPASSIEKMKAGSPLTDEDRKGWLQQLNQLAIEQQSKTGAIIACSALKEKYRQQLSNNIHEVHWVYLKGEYELIHQRMKERPHHYFSASMLQSQFDALEEPLNALCFDVHQPADVIVKNIIKPLHMKSSFGIIGLGVMGKSLALNFANHGFALSLYNRFVAGKEEQVAEHFIATHHELKTAKGFEEIKRFVQSLELPRKILLMVNAGKAIDDVIDELKPFLTAGDILIDGGNSYYKDTEKRIADLITHRIHFIGSGISGGEEGALKGPSIMPDGNVEAYKQVQPFLETIAAKDKNDKPCCTYISNGGSGHFVKMVHNAIEYAEMQLLSEVYDIMRNGLTMNPDEIAAVFTRWNQSYTGSYLLEITIAILQTKEGNDWMLDKILDTGSSKGTGSWAVTAAAELGVSAGMMTAALYTRYLSAHKTTRVQFNKLLIHEKKKLQLNVEELKTAYHLARIINHHQGFELINAAAKKHDWNMNPGELARIWTNGCIIRSQLMEELVQVFATGASIMLHPSIVQYILENKLCAETVVSESLKNGFALPALTEALNYINAIATANSAMNLIQAQRDYFGAHTYQRVDDASGKAHHTEWKTP